jgi:hypothetical protein
MRRKGVQLAHLGKCAELVKEESCPTSCNDEEEQPVCGSDGNVYRWVKARLPYYKRRLYFIRYLKCIYTLECRFNSDEAYMV